MLKSNRDLKDIVDLQKIKPLDAVGKVCIDITDPLTGKVKDRVEGKNMVFTDSILCGASGKWIDNISNMWMCLNDNDTPLNPNLPLLLGQTIGYGKSSLGSLGTYRGAYNTANSILASMDLTKIRWKFQYDFTTAQSNGVIKNIGLTRQYDTASQDIILSCNVGYTSITSDVCDGRFSYSITYAGIITRYDWHLAIKTTIDVSAIVGTTSGEKKSVGYEPMTGKYYIYVNNSNLSSRKIYKFSDNDFLTLEDTYSLPSTISTLSHGSFYVYDNKAFFIASSINNIICLDLVENTINTIAITSSNNAIETEYTSGAYDIFAGACSIGLNQYIISYGNSSNAKGIIFDMANKAILGYVNINTNNSPFINPHGNKNLICQFGSSTVINRSALTSYLLPTPITKTSANGMTATYEIEVYW